MAPLFSDRFKTRMRVMLRPPRRLRPTRAGWMFLLINLGVGFAALNTGNNLLYLVLSLLLAFLTLSGILSESALRGLEIRRTLPKEIFANANNPIRIEIRNSQRKVPAFAILIEDLAGPAYETDGPDDHAWRFAKDSALPTVGRVFALRTSPGETESRSYMLRPEKRGELLLHSVRVSTRFPFGLFLKSRTIAARASATVYPEIEVVHSEAQFHSGAPLPDAPARGQVEGSDISGLREWNPGDSLNRVHWKSSLRRDRLYVRTQHGDQLADIEVRLATRGRQAAEQFEKDVSWAASQVVSHLSSGMRVGLVTDQEHIEPSVGTQHRAKLLSFLAFVTSNQSERPLVAEASVEPSRKAARR